MTEKDKYEIFQGKYKEISEFTLARPDKEIDLASYMSECGTTHCIAGNAAGLWPEEYINKENHYGMYPKSLSSGRTGTEIIYDLAGLQGEDLWAFDYKGLTRLFGSNQYITKPDRKVIEDRLALVMKHDTLVSLCKTIVYRPGRVGPVPIEVDRVLDRQRAARLVNRDVR